MCEALGAQTTRILVTRIGGNDEINPGADEQTAAAIRSALARIQSRSCFGYGSDPEARNGGNNEVLPIATVPINSAVLREKRKLTLR
jgi:hypothetical protein